MSRYIYYPPCNCRFGSMGDGDRVECDGPPDHKGDHYSREDGMRWRGYGHLVRRCTWRTCTAPDRVLVSPDGTDRVHLCPGGVAEGMFGATLEGEGWSRG